MIVRESISFERGKNPKTALFGWTPGQLLVDRTLSGDVDYVVIYVASTEILAKVYVFGTLDKINLYPKKFTFSKSQYENGFRFGYPSTQDLSELTKEEAFIINNTLEKNKNLLEIAERATNLKIFI